jgi:hypothetical protein
LVHLTSARLAIYAVEHIPGIPATKEKKVRGLFWCNVSQQRHGRCVADGIEEIFPRKDKWMGHRCECKKYRRWCGVKRTSRAGPRSKLLIILSYDTVPGLIIKRFHRPSQSREALCTVSTKHIFSYHRRTDSQHNSVSGSCRMKDELEQREKCMNLKLDLFSIRLISGESSTVASRKQTRWK